MSADRCLFNFRGVCFPCRLRLVTMVGVAGCRLLAEEAHRRSQDKRCETPYSIAKAAAVQTNTPQSLLSTQCYMLVNVPCAYSCWHHGFHQSVMVLAEVKHVILSILFCMLQSLVPCAWFPVLETWLFFLFVLWKLTRHLNEFEFPFGRIKRSIECTDAILQYWKPLVFETDKWKHSQIQTVRRHVFIRCCMYVGCFRAERRESSIQNTGFHAWENGGG